MENNTNVSPESTTTEIPSRDRIKADAADMMEKAKTAGQQQFESGKQTAVSASGTDVAARILNLNL